MKKLLWACAFASLAGSVPATEDMRQLAQMPAAAQANLRALIDILGPVAEGKYQEAGAPAEETLGISAMGKHRSQPMDAPSARTCRQRCMA